MSEGGYRLNVMPPKGAPYTVDVDGDLLIGRDEDCDLCLQHSTVSANHALISVKGTSVSIKDLDSTNGTLVDGERVHGETWLRSNGVFEVGIFRLELIPPKRGTESKTAQLKSRAVKLDERDQGVIGALLQDWADADVMVPVVKGAEEMAATLHCSRQEVNRRVSSLESKLGLAKGARGQQRYHALAEELLRRGLGPGRA